MSTLEARKATLISGANAQEIDLPGESVTVADIMARYATLMNIPEGDRQVQLNGETAAETNVVNPGDTVEVVRKAGEKG